MKRAIIRIYFGTGRVIRNLVEFIPAIHTLLSRTVFLLRNTFNFNHHHIPYFLARRIKPGDVVIDCGANVGKITKPLLQFDPLVYCFEPNPVAFKQLKKNLGETNNVNFINKAVGTKKEVAKLFKHIDSHESDENELLYSVSASLISSKSNVDDKNYYEVEIINFIEFLDQLESDIYILKIDIEGAEVELVDAIIDKKLHNKVKYMFVETHENTMPELMDSTQALYKKTKNLGIKNIYYNWT